jgi:hypothetical protein
MAQSAAAPSAAPTHAPTPANLTAVQTELPQVSVGIQTNIAEPRPDLAGQRFVAPGSPKIYLVDPQGYLRYIPNPTTYNNLFRNWNGVLTFDIVNIAQGPAISNGAILARGSGESPVYLITNGVKDWITTPAAMDKYYFNWATVCVVPDVLVDFIPNGTNFS